MQSKKFQRKRISFKLLLPPIVESYKLVDKRNVIVGGVIDHTNRKKKQQQHTNIVCVHTMFTQKRIGSMYIEDGSIIHMRLPPLKTTNICLCVRSTNIALVL